MVYTETKERNGRKYSYRVISIRKGKKVSKAREYLGVNLDLKTLRRKESEVDKILIREDRKSEINSIKDKIIGVLKKNKIKRAGIFGSYSKGEQTKKSDIDILIEPPKGMGFGFFGIQIELENKLKKKVDLVSYNGLNSLLRKKILNEEIRIL